MKYRNHRNIKEKRFDVDLLNRLPLMLDKYPQIAPAIAQDVVENTHSHLIDAVLPIMWQLKREIEREELE